MTNGEVKACCRQPENLELLEDEPHVQVRRCRVCRCRHFRALVGERKLEPGVVKLG
jgi:hypothetical protein